MNFLRLSLIMALTCLVGCGKSEPTVDATGPFLHAKLNIELVNTILSDVKAKTVTADKLEDISKIEANLLLLSALGVNDIELLVAKEATELKILLYSKANKGFLKALTANTICAPFLKATDDSAIFNIKVPEKKSFNQKLTIGQFGEYVVLGSSDLVKKCMEDKKLPELGQVKHFVTSEVNAQFTVSVACAETIEQSIKEVLSPLLADAKTGFGLPPMIGFMVNSIAKGISKPLEKVAGLNLSVSIKDDKRQVTWNQWNRDSEKLAQQIKNIEGTDYLDFADESSIGVLMRMKVVQPKVDLDGDKLSISFNWVRESDEDSLKELGKSVKGLLGSMMNSTMGANVKKSKNKPTTKYENLFEINPNYTDAALKKDLPQQVKKAIVYSRFSKGRGTRASKESFETGKVNVVNTDLCSFKYEPKGLFVTDQNILKKSKRRSYGGNTLNFPTDSKEKAQRATVMVTVTIPQNIQVIELARADLNVLKKVGSTKVLLKEFTTSTVKIATTADTSLTKLFTFDKAGRCLASNRSKQGENIITKSYYGEVNKCKLYIFETKEFSFDLDLVIPKEKWEFPKDPSTEIPPQYTQSSDSFYNNPGETKLKNLSVSYDKLKKGLVLNLDEKGLKLEDKWYISYFGKGKELNPPKSWGGFSRMNGSAKYVKKSISKCEDCEAVFGKVVVEIDAGLEVYEVRKEKPLELKINGAAVKLSINKNRVVLSYPSKSEIEQTAIIGYDQTGKMLKRHYSVSFTTEKIKDVRFDKRGYKFYGTVDHALVQIKSKTIKKEIPFELFLTDSYNKAAYQKLKLKKVEDQRMFKLLKLLEKKQQMVDYQARRFPALSGLYYVVDKRKKTIIAGIPIEVAHANKLGAEIFGYTGKPYKGYYFSYPTEVLKNKKSKKLKTDQTRSFSYQKNGKTVTGDFSVFDADRGMLAIPQNDKLNGIYYIDTWAKVYRYTGDKKTVHCGPDLYAQDKGDWIELKF